MGFAIIPYVISRAIDQRAHTVLTVSIERSDDASIEAWQELAFDNPVAFVFAGGSAIAETVRGKLGNISGEAAAAAWRHPRPR